MNTFVRFFSKSCLLPFGLGMFPLLLAAAPATNQGAALARPVPGTPNLLRLEGTDADSGIHYVRFTLLLAKSGSSAPPHFTVECTELDGQHNVNLFVSFGGVPLRGFTPPFHPTPQQRKAPRNPSAKLDIDFEGGGQWMPMRRVWEVLPSGELRYRNPGLHSPNLESPRYLLANLSALPALRVGYGDGGPANAPADEVFQTGALLNELASTPACDK